MSTPSPDENKPLLQLQALGPNALLTDAKAQAELITFLQSPDPLTSHIATSLLLAALRQSEQYEVVPDKTWLAKLFTFPPITPPCRPTANKRQKKALTNTLEAARRVIEALYSSTVDPELRPLQQQRQEGNPSSIHDARVRKCARTAIADSALPDLHEAVVHCYDYRWLLGLEGEGYKEEEEAELPLVWLIKLGRVLRRSYQEDDEDNGEREENEMQKLEIILLQMCHAAHRATRGGVESRREALQLALEMLNDLQVEGTEAQKKRTILILTSLTSVCCYENSDKEGGEEHPASSSCSLVRKPQLSDLWPHRLYLWSRLLKLAEEEKGWIFKVEWPVPGMLEGKLIDESHVCWFHFLDGEKGRRLLMERLVDHDDILMGVLNNLVVIHCIFSNAFSSGQRSCSCDDPLFLIVPGTEPQLLLATFLELLPEESAEQVFLDFLISNETCALEYLLRLTKYMVACQDRQQRDKQKQQSEIEEEQQGEREEGGGTGSTTTTSRIPMTIPPPSASASAAVTEFLFALGQRLQGMQSASLFPYDITPLLTRIQQLQR